MTACHLRRARALPAQADAAPLPARAHARAARGREGGRERASERASERERDAGGSTTMRMGLPTATPEAGERHQTCTSSSSTSPRPTTCSALHLALCMRPCAVSSRCAERSSALTWNGESAQRDERGRGRGRGRAEGAAAWGAAAARAGTCALDTPRPWNGAPASGASPSISMLPRRAHRTAHRHAPVRSPVRRGARSTSPHPPHQTVPTPTPHLLSPWSAIARAAIF